MFSIISHLFFMFIYNKKGAETPLQSQYKSANTHKNFPVVCPHISL